MRTVYLFMSLIIALIIINCNNILQTIPKGAYNYIGYDSTGNTIIAGWLTLNLSDTTNITGEWHFNTVNNPKDIGMQTGNGNLRGGKNDSIVSINLNPNWADNNVILNGKINNDGYYGKWYWSTFIGETNKGTFKANKNK
jgi:hypothetical protein